ncbi:hypothetical protein MJ575_14005 [Klebsiella pneumoniae]|nr:hypothetical protein MJ575_14005 [Klebsiella pneumoniae]
MVNETIAADADQPVQTADRRRDRCAKPGLWPPPGAFGIHQALAGAAGAYAPAFGRPPGNWLIVGKAMSGAFLAHGYEGQRLIAFNDSGVLVHAMGKTSAARYAAYRRGAGETGGYRIRQWPRRQQLCDARPALRPAGCVIRMPDDHDLSLVSNAARRHR